MLCVHNIYASHRHVALLFPYCPSLLTIHVMGETMNCLSYSQIINDIRTIASALSLFYSSLQTLSVLIYVNRSGYVWRIVVRLSPSFPSPIIHASLTLGFSPTVFPPLHVMRQTIVSRSKYSCPNLPLPPPPPHGLALYFTIFARDYSVA
jgi:hypothetical protein